jgi:hypothetical protein
MAQTVSPETLVFNLNQTPGSYPKEDNFNKMFSVTDMKYVSLPAGYKTDNILSDLHQ